MAAKVFQGGTGTGEWNTNANWVGGAFAVAGDTVTFSSNNNPCNINVASACTSIICTGWTGVLTFNNTLTVSGTVTFVSGMGTIAGTSDLICNTTATLTSGGKTLSGGLQLKGTSQTYILGDAWTVTGTTICSGTTLITINGFSISTNGLTISTSTTGTTTFTLIGTGTWSGNNGFTNDLTINSTTTTLSGTFRKSGGTLTYTAGTIVSTGSTLNIALSSTLNTSGMTFNNVNAVISGVTVTLTSDLNVSGTTTLGSAAIGTLTLSAATAKNLNTASLVFTGSTPTITSTNVTIVMNATGSWSSSCTGEFISVPITINSGAGTTTLSGTIRYGDTATSSTLTYTSGTIVNTSSTLILRGASTLNTSGMSFNHVTASINGVGSQTVTLTSNLNVAGDFSYSGSVNYVFNGAYYINVSGSLIFTLAAANTFSGTATIKLNGTGTWSQSGAFTPSITIPIEINSPSGTITLSGSFHKTGSLTYTAGTIVSTGSTLNWVSGSLTVNASGFNLDTLTVTGNSRFLGTNGFTIQTFNCSTVGIFTTWKSGNEYTIGTSFQSSQADGVSRITYTSDDNAIFIGSISTTVLTVTSVGSGTITVGSVISATSLTTGVTVSSLGTGTGGTGTYNLSSSSTLSARTFISAPTGATYSKITLAQGATQSLVYSNGYLIDSGNGQTIWTFGSDYQRTINWNTGTRPLGYSYVWIN